MNFLSPSTASSLNNQAEESALVVVFERWWFTAGGRQEMLPVQHCRLVAGWWGEKDKTAMQRGKIKPISCMWRQILPLCPNLQSQCKPTWDSLPPILPHQQHEAGHKDLRAVSAWGGSFNCRCILGGLGHTQLPLPLVLSFLSLPSWPMLWWPWWHLAATK